jgi:arylsulfatase A-like enzyme/Flp pilus assembly protein TadD
MTSYASTPHSKRLVLFLLALAASSFAQDSRTSVKASRPNVVLVTMDTLRADHVGCYGYREVKTPTLDALAQDGVLFEHADSQVPLTWPSHTAILTGTYPFQNGVQDFTGQPLDPRFRSLAQAFHEKGYATGAVVSAFVLDRSWGLARGFDFYDDAFSPVAFQTKDPGLVDRKADQSVSHTIRWLTQERAYSHHPFFFWLHLYDPHSPYDPPEPFRTEYRDHLYDGEIAYADHELGRLISWLKRNQLYDGSLIIFLSDHGESLGEHGEKEHGFFIYNSTVHVPLIVKPPSGSGIRHEKIATSVETVGVAPTILSLAGLHDAIERQFTAPPLLRRGKQNEGQQLRPVYNETFYPFSSFGWSPLHSIEERHYRYIDAPQPELYDENADPDETHNLASQLSATASVLKQKLDSLLHENPYQPKATENSTLTPEAEEKLRTLGYVAFRSPVSPDALASGLPDPKDKLDEFNAILSAEDALRSSQFETGEKLLTRVEEQDPKMYIVPFIAGESAARRGDWKTSAAEFQKCLALNPTFDQAMTGLARALFNLGDIPGATQSAENALKVNSNNWRAWYELARIQGKSDPQAGLNDYEKAVAIQPNFAPLQRDLGMTYFLRQDYANSATHLARAAQLGLEEARLYNFLGISYDRTNHLRQAIESYEHALHLDDNSAEAHLNLGFTYHRLHRDLLASREYQRACQLKADFCSVIPKAEKSQTEP